MKSKTFEEENQNIKEIGHVESFYGGVAKIRGLRNVQLHEVLNNENGEAIAIVIGFDQDFVEAVFFNDECDFAETIFRGNKIFSIPKSQNYVGRIVNGLALPLDTEGELSGEESPVFCTAPQIYERKPIARPLITGIKLIDTTLPLGRGQRELIIGDRKLGKSTIAQDIVLNRQGSTPPVVCVYVVIGKEENEVNETVSLFKQSGALSYTVVVAATGQDSYAEQYLAPFVGCTIAEYFRDKGQDALVVYDDLSNHAKTYRDIALLLERPPGREVYPGNIFSIHAGLLERAAQLSDDKGGGSLSAIPIVQTEEGDLTSYIATNLISITDGQIYLESGLFRKRYLPAINVGLSVSRVSSKVQPPILKNVTEALRLSLAQQKELQKLTQLETTISNETQKAIHRGDLILELLKQDKHTNYSWEEQAILFYAVEHGEFDEVEKAQWPNFERSLLELAETKYKKLLKDISGSKLDKKIKSQINSLVAEFKHEFLNF